MFKASNYKFESDVVPDSGKTACYDTRGEVLFESDVVPDSGKVLFESDVVPDSGKTKF